MKKLIVSIFICISILTAAVCTLSAAEIVLYAPTESEIMPTRDFYVVGKVDRKGQSALSMPLNIKVELTASSGKVIRSVESNVGKSGTTPAEYFLLDYEQGTVLNDSKGIGLNLFTPPDILFDGVDRNTVRSTQNKIVVKEDYFAAVLYGGATKDFELDYFDENQKPLTDITGGTYTLTVIATDLNGEVACKKESQIVFGDEKGRVISSDNSLILDYIEENDLTLSTSFAGFWKPSQFFSASTDFSYTVSKRVNDNVALEYKNAKDVSILLYNLNTADSIIASKFAGAYENPANKTYLYFDIGEKVLNFNFNGANLTKNGTVVSTSDDKFIEILRSETIDEDNTYVDFDSSDGFVLTRGNPTAFYGVFSPVIKALGDSDTYTPIESTTSIKYTITSNDGEVLSEGYAPPFISRGEDNTPCKYEFRFEITPDSALVNGNAAYLTLSLCDSENKEIFTADSVSVKVNQKGDFIGNYDETYWGKSFCDVMNTLGQPPAGEALSPDEFITRGNFAAMINRLFGYSISSRKEFEDLDENSIYYSDCSVAQAAGYMTGDENGMVKADDFISREQAMIILARISKADMGKKNVVFKDSDQISFWAKDYVDIMTTNGIVSGFDGYLNPTDSITVAEATALLIKTFKWMHEGEIKNSDISSEEVEENLGSFDIESADFISDVNYDSVSAFLNANPDTFSSLVNHFIRNYGDGIYISRVGNGLEVRDYHLGSYIRLSDEALKITTALSEKFAEFSIRYNPKSEVAVHFILGRNEDGKQVGLTYTTLEEVKNKTLTHIDGNWYYYIQK